MRGNDGYTHLLLLSGVPTFVDDLYVFGYLEEKDLVCAKGKVLCTSGWVVVSKIAVCIRALVDSKHIHTAFVPNTTMDASKNTGKVVFLSAH